MTGPLPQSDAAAQQEEPPPLLRTWARLYSLVILWLTVLIILFYAFTRRFAP